MLRNFRDAAATALFGGVVVSAAVAVSAVVALGASGDAPSADRRSDAVVVAAYDFENPDARPAPTEVHADVEAGLFMHMGFFPPTSCFFDGSRDGDEGEAVVDGHWPEYYEFTVEGLDLFERLDALRFNVVTRRRHASAAHTISVKAVEDEGRTIVPLKFDFYDRGDDTDQDEPAEAGVESVRVGEASPYLGFTGNTGTIVVDLSDLPAADERTLRIVFDAYSHRSRTAVDNVELTATPASD